MELLLLFAKVPQMVTFTCRRPIFYLFSWWNISANLEHTRPSLSPWQCSGFRLYQSDLENMRPSLSPWQCSDFRLYQSDLEHSKAYMLSSEGLHVVFRGHAYCFPLTCATARVIIIFWSNTKYLLGMII